MIRDDELVTSGIRVVSVGLVVAAVILAAGTALGALRLGGGFGKSGVVTLQTGEVMGLAASKKTGVVAVGFSGRQMLVVRLSKTGKPGPRCQPGRALPGAW